MAQSKLLEALGISDPDAAVEITADDFKTLKKAIEALKKENSELKELTKEGKEKDKTKKEVEDFKVLFK